MSLNNASVLSGATLVVPTGGTAITFSSRGGTQNNRNVLFCNEDDDLRSQRTVDCYVKPPKPSISAPGGSTQARAGFVFKSPKELANTNNTVNTARFEISYDPEMVVADIDELKVIAVQLIQDADFTDLYQNLATT